jgi:hypothetical protein
MKKIRFIILLVLSVVFMNPVNAEIIKPWTIGFLSTLGCTSCSALFSYIALGGNKEPLVGASILGAFVGYKWIAPTITAEYWYSSITKFVTTHKTTTSTTPGKKEKKYAHNRGKDTRQEWLYHRWSNIGSWSAIILCGACIFGFLQKA